MIGTVCQVAQQPDGDPDVPSCIVAEIKHQVFYTGVMYLLKSLLKTDGVCVLIASYFKPGGGMVFCKGVTGVACGASEGIEGARIIFICPSVVLRVTR